MIIQFITFVIVVVDFVSALPVTRERMFKIINFQITKLVDKGCSLVYGICIAY